MEARRVSVSDTLYMRDRENIRGFEAGPASDEDEDDDDDEDEGRLQIDLDGADEERSEANKTESISQRSNVVSASDKVVGKNSKSKTNPLKRLQQLVQAPFLAPQISTAGGNTLQGCDTYTGLCGSSSTLTYANKQSLTQSGAINNGELSYPYNLSSVSSRTAHQYQQQQHSPHMAYGASLPTLTPRPGSANQIDQNGSQSTVPFVGASSTCATTITPINNANAPINFSRMQRVRNKLKAAAIDELNIRHLQKLTDDDAQSFYKFRETVLQSSLAQYPVDGLMKAFKSPLKLQQSDFVTVTAIGDDSTSPKRQPPSVIELAPGVRTPRTLTVISYRGHAQQPLFGASTLPLRGKVNNRRSPPPMVPIESLANFRMQPPPPLPLRDDGICKSIEDNVMTRLKKLGTDIELEKIPATITPLPSSVTCTPTLPEEYDDYGYGAGFGEDEDEEEEDDDLPSFPFAVDCVLSTESSPPSPPPMPVVTKTNNGGYMSTLKQMGDISFNSTINRVQPPPPSLIPIGCSSMQPSQQLQSQQQTMARFVPISSLANDPSNWMNNVIAATNVIASSPEMAATTITAVPIVPTASTASKKKKRATLAGSGGAHKKPKTNKSDIAKLAHALVMQPGMTAPQRIVIATNDKNDEIKTTTVMVKPQLSPFLASDDVTQSFSNEVDIIKLDDGPSLETPITVAFTQPASTITPASVMPSIENQLFSVTATAPSRKTLHGASAALDQTMVCTQVVGSGRKLYSCSICSSVYHKPYNVRKHVYRQHLNLRYIDEKEAKKYEIGWPLESAGLGPISEEIGLFRCDTCFRIFDEGDALKLHLLEHPPREDVMSKSRAGRFPCPSCSLKFSKKKVFQRHLNECQEYVANQSCGEFGLSTSSPPLMLTRATSPQLPSPSRSISAVVFEEEQHEQQPVSVLPVPVAVPIPPPIPPLLLPPPPPPLPPEESSVTVEEAPVEQEERKDEEEDVEETVNRLCLFCDLEFTDNAARQRHVLQQHHPKRKRQSCAYCKKRGFTDLRDLLRHIVSSHGDIYFGCLLCKVRFKTNDELTAHDIESHQSEESSPKKAEGEKKIEKTVNTENTKPSIVVNATLKNGRTYKCSSCSKVFNSMLELSRHRKAEHRAPKSTIRNTSSTNDYSYDSKYRNTVITSTDYETEFYRNLSNNVRLNIEAHMEGKIADARRPTEKAMTRSCLANLSGDKERGDGQRDRENDTELSFQDMYGAENISGRFIRNVSRLHLETQLTMLKKANLLNKNVGGDAGLPNVRNACIARELSLTPQKTDSGMPLDQSYEEETNHIGGIFSGEWIKEKKYVCAACFQSFNGFWEWDDHRWTKHPNVWNTYYVFPSEHAPGRNWAMKLSLNSAGVLEKSNEGKTVTTYATNTPSSLCTKCQKTITPLSEFHKHILECGGDANWMATIYTPTKRHKKWKPYCGHRRKKTVPKRRMFLRNIPETPIKLPNLSRNKQKAGDSESIQRMIANLPPKRITRRVVSFDDIDSKNRNRGKVRDHVLTRQRRERLDPKTSAQIAKTFAVDSYETNQTEAALKRNKQLKRKPKLEELTTPLQQTLPAPSIPEKSVSPTIEIKTEPANDYNVSGDVADSSSSSNSSTEDTCSETTAKTSRDDSSSELPTPPQLMPAPSLDTAVDEDEERSFELMTIDATTEENAPSLPDSAVILAAMRETMRQTDVAIPNQVFKERKRKRCESKKENATKTTGRRRRSSASNGAVEVSPNFICRECGSVVFGSVPGPDEICIKCRAKKERVCVDCKTTIIDAEENGDGKSIVCDICEANQRATDEIIRAVLTEMVNVVCEATSSPRFSDQVTGYDTATVYGSALPPATVRTEKSADVVSHCKEKLNRVDSTVTAVSTIESVKKALFQDESDDVWDKSEKTNNVMVASVVGKETITPPLSVSKAYEQLKAMECYENAPTVVEIRARRQSTASSLSSEEPNTSFGRRTSTNGEYLPDELNTLVRRKSSDVIAQTEETPSKESKDFLSATKLKPLETPGKNNHTNINNVILQCRGCHGLFVTVSSYKEHSEKCPFHNANQETDKKPLLGFAKRNQNKKKDESTSSENGNGSGSSSGGSTNVGGAGGSGGMGPCFEILETVPLKSLEGALLPEGGKSPVDLSAQSENLVPPVLFDGDTMCGPLRRTAYKKATQQSIQETIDSVIEKFCKSSTEDDVKKDNDIKTIGDSESGSMCETNDEFEECAPQNEKKLESTRKKTSKSRREPVDATVAEKSTRQLDSQRSATRNQQRREVQCAVVTESSSKETEDEKKVNESVRGGKKSRKRAEQEQTKSESTVVRKNNELRSSKRKKHESGHRARAQLKLRRTANVERPLSKRMTTARKRRIEENVNEGVAAKKRKMYENADDSLAEEEMSPLSEKKTDAGRMRRKIVKSSKPTPVVRVLRSKRKKPADVTAPTTKDGSTPKNVEAADDRVSNARSKKSKTKDEAECAKADSSAMNVIKDSSNGDTAAEVERKEERSGKDDLINQLSNGSGKSSQKRKAKQVDDETATTDEKRSNCKDLGFLVAKTASKITRSKSLRVIKKAAKEGDTKKTTKTEDTETESEIENYDDRSTLSHLTNEENRVDELCEREETNTFDPFRCPPLGRNSAVEAKSDDTITVNETKITDRSDVEQLGAAPAQSNTVSSSSQEEINFLGVAPSIPSNLQIPSSAVNNCFLNDESALSMGDESMAINAFGTQYSDDNIDGQTDKGQTWYSDAIDFLGQRSFGSLGSIINSVNELLADPEVISSYSLDDIDSCHEEALQYYMNQNPRDENFATLVEDLENSSQDLHSSTLEDENPPTLMDLDRQLKPNAENDNTKELEKNGRSESKTLYTSVTRSSMMVSMIEERKQNEEETKNGKIKTSQSTVEELKKLKCNHCHELFSSKDDIAVHVQEHLRKFALSKTDNALLLRKCISKKFEGLLVEKALTNYLKSPQKAIFRNNNSLKLLSMVSEAKKNQLSTWKNAISQMLETERNTSLASETIKAALIEPSAVKDRSKNSIVNGDQMENGEMYPCPMCPKTFEQTNQRNRHLIMVHARQTKKSKPQSRNENCSDEASTTDKIIESYLLKNTIDSCSTKSDKQINDVPTKQNGVVETKSNGATLECETSTNGRRDLKPAITSSNSSTVKSKNATRSDNTHPAFMYFDVKSDKPATAATATTSTQESTDATSNAPKSKDTKSSNRTTTTSKKITKKTCRKKMSRKEMNLPPDLVKRKAEQALRELTFGRFIRTS